MVSLEPGGGASSLREIGHLASWAVTSAKPGNGVELLRDGRTDTFWQSDGLQPHLINVQFQRRVPVQEVHIYLDYKLDESYTPSRISVRAGIGAHDVKEVRVIEMSEPTGWIVIPLGVPASQMLTLKAADTQGSYVQPLQTFFIQIAVVANHQNGRDTHVRGVKVFGQQTDPLQAVVSLPLAPSSTQMQMYMALR